MKFGNMDWWLAIYMKSISQMTILLYGWNLARWMIVNNVDDIDKPTTLWMKSGNIAWS
jgi:hypothetical protein